MRKFLLLSFPLLCAIARSQTLPANAQALYTEFYNSDVSRGQYAANNGAQAMATADGNSFYLKWLPSGATASATPMLVTLHGSDGNAFNEFFVWHQRAQAKGVGIIALQWYRGSASVAPNDYFDDPVLYTYIDTALKRIKYPSQKAFLHGFSRGSARSYAVAFYDVRPGGKNYFCTILSNAGKPDSAYTLYSQINGGTYGHTLFAGKKWAMFCGGQDPSPAQSGCVGMNSAKNWVMANGGTVGLYISDPNLAHGGFHQTSAYIDSALNYYLQCYNTISSIPKTTKNEPFSIFPNPSKDRITINSELPLNEELKIIGINGILVKKIKLSGTANDIDLRELDNGLYFLVFANQRIKVVKE